MVETGLVSGREAARRLETVGVGRRRVRTLLASGVVGAPVALAGRAHLYESARVEELARRTEIALADLDELCPAGIFIARRYVDCSAPEPELSAALGRDWPLSPYTAIWIRAVRIRREGSFPFVATICGFVVHGAEITGVETGAGGTFHLELGPPGPWFTEVAHRRLSTPAGKPWTIRGWPPPTISLPSTG